MRWKLDETPDLSPDLDWMLQSGQASRALLAETLAEEFYPGVYYLALAYLGDETAALTAVLQAFQSALADSSRYRPAFGVKTWLYRQVVKSCRQVSLKTWGLQRLRKISKPSYPRSQAENRSPDRSDDPLFEAIRALPGQLRMAVLLQDLVGLEEREIAWILGQVEGQVRDRLEIARQKLQAGLGPVEGTPAESFELFLSRRLEARWPPRQITPLERRQLLTSLAGRESRQRKMASLGELLWIGLAVLAAAGLAWGSRPETPGPEVTPLPLNTPTPAPTQAPDYSVSYFAQPGETLLSISAKTGIPIEQLLQINTYAPDAVFTRVRRVQLPAPPFPQAPTPVPPLSDAPNPLSARSQASILKQRLSANQPVWRTLWVDAQFVNYGPPGYVGPAQTYRTQVWISWPDQSIQLVGPVSGEPLYRFLIQGKYIYFFSRDSNASWYSESPELLVSWSALSSLIFPNRAKWLHELGEFQVTGKGEAAGRPAILADWKNLSGQRLHRLWIDTQTGIILHQQEFGGQEGQAVIADYSITAITYNASFPPELFDPSQNRLEYVQDYLGNSRPFGDPLQLPTLSATMQREPLQRQPAPPRFDPARSELTFQYPDSQPSSGSAPMIDLFAGRFYLGSLPFADPWNVLCNRSPDGRRLAFSLKPGWQEAGSRFNTGLHWFDLADLEIHSPPSLIEASSFAFAPDSRRMAVFGYPADSKPGIVLLDTGTGEVTRLFELEEAESLTWSPDGKKLALVGKRAGGSELEVLVLEAATGEIVYNASVDPQVYQQVLALPDRDGEWPTRDWPGHGWGTPFPVKMGELEACSAAPSIVAIDR